jgi:transposase
VNLSRLYELIVSRENEAGQAAEDPRLLVAIRVWCYREGISSSRQVEHPIEQEPALMWR